MQSLLALLDNINDEEHKNEDEIEDARDSGYDDGYDAGHGDGVDEGHNEGYDEGHDDGYEEGYNRCIDEVTELLFSLPDDTPIGGVIDKVDELHA